MAAAHKGREAARAETILARKQQVDAIAARMYTGRRQNAAWIAFFILALTMWHGPLGLLFLGLGIVALIVHVRNHVDAQEMAEKQIKSSGQAKNDAWSIESAHHQ